MRLFRLLPTFLFIVLCSFLKAQTLSVESFKLLPNDLTANTFGTMERDQNGEVAALIKVVTSETGFVFDGGMMGIVKSEQKTGEVWIYVPYGLQKITISHQQLGVLRDYYFPVPIEKARTYEMKLLSGRVRTVIEDDFAAQYVVFSLEPKNAIVYIDGAPYSAQSDGTVTQLLSYGAHEYRVEAYGYKTEAGVLQMGSEKIFRDVKLQSTISTITLQCTMPEADLYINDEKVGTGSWTGQLAPALYKIESKREYYQSRVITLTVRESEERTVTVPEPLVQYGKLQVQSSPFNATVYIDGIEVGTTPLYKGDLIAGNHIVDISLDDYLEYHTVVTVDGTETTELNVTLQFDVAKQARQEKERNRLEREKIRASKIYLKSTDVYFGVTLARGGCEPCTEIRVGADYNNLNVELRCGLFDSGRLVYDGYWSSLVPQDINGDGKPDGYKSYIYTYGFKTLMGVSVGYGVMMGKLLRITPQIGASIYHIESIYDESISALGGSGNNKSYVMSVPLSLKCEFSPVKHVAVVYYPQYSIPVKYGSLAEKLNSNDDAVEKSIKGLCHNMGLIVYF